jgi:ADP-ribose pyrophosphatase
LSRSLSRKKVAFRKTPKLWRTLESRKVSSIGQVSLHKDRIISKNGFEMVHSTVSMPDFSIIVPVLDNNRLVMIWNYRHAIDGWELELPAGHIENGERPRVCARRELEEETGYSARSWRKLGWFHPSPGTSSQKAYAYLARNLSKGSINREPYEVGMEVKTLSIRQAYRLLWRGEIVHSPTASALGIAEPGLLKMKRSTVSRRS